MILLLLVEVHEQVWRTITSTFTHHLHVFTHIFLLMASLSGVF